MSVSVTASRAVFVATLKSVMAMLAFECEWTLEGGR